MIRWAHVVFISLVIILVTGCETAKLIYKEPLSGDVATIIFVSKPMVKFDELDGVYFTGDSGGSIYQDAKDCSGRQYFGSIPSSDNKELKVPGEQLLSFTYGYEEPVRFDDASYGSRSCLITVTFYPESGSVYQASFRNPTTNTCSVVVEELDSSGNVRQVPVRYREDIRGWDETSSFCKYDPKK
jgi:hypothetical protein